MAEGNAYFELHLLFIIATKDMGDSEVSSKREVRILVACGTAIATATLVATKIEERFRKMNIPVSVARCKAFEVAGKVEVFKPDVIVANTPVSERDAKGIPIINGFPFITGIGEDEAVEQILKAIGLKQE
ncbi:MAG: PTS lactose transporter subunit IIB [Thermoproteota archaeon]|nr:MAG: PTS lactose transporter subunit IIB [Candidatus Korarchaeota archaeon]